MLNSDFTVYDRMKIIVMPFSTRKDINMDGQEGKYKGGYYKPRSACKPNHIHRLK